MRIEEWGKKAEEFKAKALEATQRSEKHAETHEKYSKHLKTFSEKNAEKLKVHVDGLHEIKNKSKQHINTFQELADKYTTRVELLKVIRKRINTKLENKDHLTNLNTLCKETLEKIKTV